MKDSFRRPVLFLVIVGLGSVLILVNIPLIYMLLLIVAVGFGLLVAFGTITAAEIKSIFAKVNPAHLRAGSGKSSGAMPAAGIKTPVAKEIKQKPPENTLQKKSGEPSGGIQGHLSLLAASFGSLGKILSESRKPKKKADDIDKLLDHTIAEKIPRRSALESAAAVSTSDGARTSEGSGSPAASGKEVDPFLTLSGEELDTGLLDGLDEGDLSVPALPPEEPETPAAPDAGLSMPDLDMPPLPDGDNDAANAILAAHASDDEGEGLSGLDGTGDALGGDLGELDDINLDEVELGEVGAAEELSSDTPASAETGPAPGAGSFVLTASAAPIAGPGGNEEQGDISSFAAGSATMGSDEDMLSSLATDIKIVKKEKDVSLLRELKDFKAPATDIETELSGIADQLNAAANKGAKKRNSQAPGIK